MDDPKKKSLGEDEEIDVSVDAPVNTPADASATDWRSTLPATYGLEQPVLCCHCKQEIDKLYVVRLYRAKVNFVSSLPRSGRVLVCPHCRTIVPGELGAVL
jgi:hypothetical protein